MTETTSVPETGPTPISDLPTGEPIPTRSDSKAASSITTPPPTPPSPTSSRTTTTITTLPALLKALPSSADAFLSHLQRCLATPSGVDTLLLFVCYLSRFTGASLTRLSQTLLRRTARELVALVFTLPPPKAAIIIGAAGGTTITSGKNSSAPARTAAARLAALLGKRLSSLGSLASEARTIARLWSLVGMYFWAKRLTLQLLASYSSSSSSSSTGNGNSSTATSEKDDASEGGSSSSSDKLAALVDWAQLVSCVMFQVLENGAYLSGRGVLGWTPAEQGRAYVVGSRWLCVYTGLELGRLLAGLVSKGGGDLASAEERDEVDAMRRSMAINLAWAPLTLHWATEKGFLSDLAVGAGGCIPGVLQMRKLWRDTA